MKLVNSVIIVLLFASLFTSCGKREEKKIDSDIMNDVVMQAQLEYKSEPQNTAISEKAVATPVVFDGNVTVSAVSSNEQFVCVIYGITKQINDEIFEEREMVRLFHKKLLDDDISEEEEIVFIKLLMKYRLLGKNKYYYSATRYTSSEIEENIAQDAISFYRKKGMPSKCIYTEKRSDGAFYEVSDAITSDDCKNEMLRRIQVISPGMVVSQATVESNWGASRFAINGNNLFGTQYRFSDESEVQNRPFCIAAQKDVHRCVYKYISIADGIREYYRNMNAGTYQPEFRKIRSGDDHDVSNCYDASDMIDGLVNYAENNKYVRDIKNNLNVVCPMMDKCDGENIKYE